MNYSQTKEYRKLKSAQLRRSKGIPCVAELPEIKCRQCHVPFKRRSIRATCCSKFCSTKWFSINRKRDTPEEKKDRRLKDKHDLSTEKLKALISLQNNLCALCGLPFDETIWNLKPCIEHNHSCCPKNSSCEKCRRGIVHYSCNIVLGHAHDNSELLRKAAEYLERYEKI